MDHFANVSKDYIFFYDVFRKLTSLLHIVSVETFKIKENHSTSPFRWQNYNSELYEIFLYFYQKYRNL